MEDLKNNKLVWFVGVMFMINMFGFVGTKVMVEKAAQRAVDMLEREYSPAKPPYGPGLNPDRIDLQKQPSSNQWQTNGPSYENRPNPTAWDAPRYPNLPSWRDNWEDSRH